MRIRMWLQKPPKVQWVLKVTHETEDGTASARTWFEPRQDRRPPPPAETAPVAIVMSRLVRAALEGPAIEDAKYAVEHRRP